MYLFLQLQVEPISGHHVSKYRSMPQAFFLIYKEEGISALWKGHVPAQFLSVVYGMAQVQSKIRMYLISIRKSIDTSIYSNIFKCILLLFCSFIHIKCL